MHDDEPQSSTRKVGGNHGTVSAGGFGGGQVGAELASGEAVATDAFARQMALFAERAKEQTNGKLLKGKLFEFIEAAKFDRNAARAGKTGRAHVTAAEGQPTSAVDIALTDVSGKPRDVQAKAWGKAKDLANQATKEKYEGMDVLVPKDKVETTNRILTQTGENREVVGELRSGGTASGGTNSVELEWATNNPKLYRLAVEVGQIGREVAVTSAHAAVGGGGAWGRAVDNIQRVRVHGWADGWPYGDPQRRD